MNEKDLRAKIAYDIRAELVCCNEYDRVQEYDRRYQADGKRLWSPEESIPNYHAICHWGEAAARIAENRSDDLPNGLCGNKEDHEPHEHESDTLGKFWCTADQKSRLPFAAEMKRKANEQTD